MRLSEYDLDYLYTNCYETDKSTKNRKNNTKETYQLCVY